MAEHQEAVHDNDKGGGIASVVAAAILGAASMVGKAWNAVMADGMLEAAGRQGIDELGTALKAFPDSIQVQESGSIWNPTPGEIQAERAEARSMWPETANHNRHLPEHDHGQEHDAGHSM